MKIAGKTDIGHSRAENQDTYRSGNLPGVAAWGVVCDGMGGGAHGRLASAVAADCIEEMLYQQLKEPESPVLVQEVLRDAIRLANAEVFARSGGGSTMMGTTVVCGLLRRGSLYLAHVGDSRAYLFEDGRLTQLTRDHSMVQELVDMGTITMDQAGRHPERNVITRALGVEEDVQPTFSQTPVQSGGTVLLCSDGLTNALPFKVLEEMLASVDFWDLPRELIGRALKAGGDDNITALLLQVEEDDG